MRFQIPMIKNKKGAYTMKTNSKILQLGGLLLGAAILLSGCGKTTADTKTPAAADSSSASDISAADTSSSADSASTYGFPAQMPAFTAKDLDGSTVTESIFADKDLTVVNIWGTFCPPCIGEMPELGEWAKEMPDNVQLIGLISDIAGDEDIEHHDLAVEIMDKADADFLQISANQDFITIRQGLVGVPTTLFVDKEGNLVGDPIVGADVDGYKKFVEDYLNDLSS